jgi:hypothetical protein
VQQPPRPACTWQASHPLLGAHGRKHEKCTLDYCDRPHQANGLCSGHKTQRQRGRPLQPLGSKGWFADPKGYVWVKAPDHANAKKNGYVQEHVKVMSEMLGRPLRSGETVHHKDLIRGDNRPDNLELWTSHQPKGARVQDMVEWCRWFLAKYGDAFPE